MDQLLDEIRRLIEAADDKTIKKYNLQQTERIVIRLNSFTDCEECQTYLGQFDLYIKEIGSDLKAPNKNYFEFIRKVTDHLQKKHQLVTEGYYTNIYMAIGLGIGLPIGVALGTALGQMVYIGIGLPLGIGFGVALGSSMDTKAKKDGMVI